MRTFSLKMHSLWLALIGVGGSIIMSPAQTASIPEGYFNINIAAGYGTSSVLSSIAFPLQEDASASGQMVGVVTGLTASTISNSNAGWTGGQLSQASTPYLIQIITGAAAGRIFLISTGTSNTATTVTIDPSDAAAVGDLTTLGIALGTDTYQIIPADTISSIFGTPVSTGIQGGVNSGSADQIQLLSPAGAWTAYYYDTTAGWTAVATLSASGNVVIRPDTAVLYNRLAATPLTLTLMGRVPSVTRKSLVSNNGLTFLSNDWPVDMTLVNSQIQNIVGWVTGSSSVADTIQVLNPNHVGVQYYNNGTHWLRVGPPINSDNIVIPAGAAVIITKKGSAAGYNILTESLPYKVTVP